MEAGLMPRHVLGHAPQLPSQRAESLRTFVPWRFGRRTNREIYRVSRSPICEWEPEGGRLAMLRDAFHALATVVIERRRGFDVDQLRLCEDCAKLERFRRLNQQPLPRRISP